MLENQEKLEILEKAFESVSAQIEKHGKRRGYPELVDDMRAKIWEQHTKFRFDRVETSAIAFVWRLARHLASDRDRKIKGRREVAIDSAALVICVMTGSPVEEIERRECQLDVRRALARLRPREQDIIDRRNVDGQSFSQIARELNITESGAWRRHSRALCALRQTLDRSGAA